MEIAATAHVEEEPPFAKNLGENHLTPNDPLLPVALWARCQSGPHERQLAQNVRFRDDHEPALFSSGSKMLNASSPVASAQRGDDGDPLPLASCTMAGRLWPSCGSVSVPHVGA